MVKETVRRLLFGLVVILPIGVAVGFAILFPLVGLILLCLPMLYVIGAIVDDDIKTRNGEKHPWDPYTRKPGSDDE